MESMSATNCECYPCCVFLVVKLKNVQISQEFIVQPVLATFVAYTTVQHCSSGTVLYAAIAPRIVDTGSKLEAFFKKVYFGQLIYHVWLCTFVNKTVYAQNVSRVFYAPKNNFLGKSTHADRMGQLRSDLLSGKPGFEKYIWQVVLDGMGRAHFLSNTSP